MRNSHIVNLLSLITLCFCFNWIIGGLNGANTFRSSTLCPKAPNDGPPFRFHKETRKCYQVGEKGPCNDLMKFNLEDDDFGVCDCDQTLRCGRPLVYWPSMKRCYFLYEQGPCRDGKWLVFGFNLDPVCRKNICQNYEEKQPSYGTRYWFTHNHTCYRTYTQGYCSAPDEVLFNMKTHYRPTCQKQPNCGIPDRIQKLQCLPGQKLDVYGQCNRQFVPLTNTTTKDLRIRVTQRPPNIYCLFCNN